MYFRVVLTTHRLQELFDKIYIFFDLFYHRNERNVLVGVDFYFCTTVNFQWMLRLYVSLGFRMILGKFGWKKRIITKFLTRF